MKPVSTIFSVEGVESDMPATFATKPDRDERKFRVFRFRTSKRKAPRSFSLFLSPYSCASHQSCLAATGASLFTVPPMKSAPQVAVIMGSKSDWDTMKHASAMLEQFGIPHESKVVSAHRTPELMHKFAKDAAARGIQVIIAGAGGAAHLPGMVAAQTHLPVLGVPVQSKALSGMDSLFSKPAVIALHNKTVCKKLVAFRKKQTDDVLGQKLQ